MGNIVVLGQGFSTVGELMDALSQLSPDTPLTPFGSGSTVLFYVKSEDQAYLDDNFDWLDDESYEELDSQL